MKKHICTFVPSDILLKIEQNGTPAQRAAARRTLAQSARIRANRLAPVPQPHVGDEDRVVYDAENGTRLPGKKVQEEQDPTDPDQAVNEAFHAAGNTYKLFFAQYGRRSFDDKNAQLVATVHYDKDFDNAFWDGSQMVYGDGQFFNPFTRDLTVIGHELTHAVTQYTANLEYQGQSGALNEHVSDAFGCMVEQYAYNQTAEEAPWLVGALLCYGKINGRGLRDMLNPGTAYDDPVIGKDPQPAHMKDYVDTYQDNGGVHINSGIPNRAFALASREIGGYAWISTGAVWYKTLTEKLKPNSQFQEFANATFASAAELFGKDSKEQTAIANGWKTVGIAVSDQAPVPTPEPDPQSPCAPLLYEIMSDQKTVRALMILGRNPKVRQLINQIYQTMKLVEK